jgi:hypothetical protein
MCRLTYDPFVKSRSDIETTLKVLCTTPMNLMDFDRRPEVVTRYESLIAQQLEAGGFKVIPSSEYSAIRDPLVEKMGGVFDPVTGERDAAKLKAIKQHTMNELIAKFGIDGCVDSAVVVTKASWYGNSAAWDGVQDNTTGKEGFWAGLSVGQSSGTIPALSLLVRLGSTSDETYYVGRGGIQLFAHNQGGFADIPDSMWFVDPARDVEAVNIALAPLLNEPPAK